MGDLTTLLTIEQNVGQHHGHKLIEQANKRRWNGPLMRFPPRLETAAFAMALTVTSQ
jgi:hypothetical protein